MTIKEKREELVRICEEHSTLDCARGLCPLDSACKLCYHIPESMIDADIERVYAAYKKEVRS